jgi:hypothetical protein
MAKPLKIRKDYKLAQETIDLIARLAEKLNQDNTGVVELAVKRLAEKEKLIKKS